MADWLNRHASTLETRIKTLEEELLRTRSASRILQDSPGNATGQVGDDLLTSPNGGPSSFSDGSRSNHRHDPSAIQSVNPAASNGHYLKPQKFPVLEPETGCSPPILIYGGRTSADESIVPPGIEQAQQLVEEAYAYVQARYCIVDWVQIRHWHRQRDHFLSSTPDSDASSQTGAFFIWIIYAIGARFNTDAGQETSEAYFNRASKYLPAVMTLQDMSTVQALLCMIQYCFRAPRGPSLWDLTRMVTSLCIKLRYHRSVSKGRYKDAIDPYTVELRKRFWWCAFCFDR